MIWRVLFCFSFCWFIKLLKCQCTLRNIDKKGITSMFLSPIRIYFESIVQLHHRLLQMLLNENKNIQSKIYRHMQAITTNNFFWQIKTRCTLQSFVKYHNYNLSIVMTNYKGKQSINLYYMDLRKCVQFCKTYRLPQSLLFSFICT